MKKLFVMAAVTMMAAVGVHAQNGYEDTKHEVAVSYGVHSTSQWVDVFENASVTLTTATLVKYTDGKFIGPISAEYFYHLKSWFGLGGVFVYGKNKQDMLIGDKKDGTLMHSYFTLMPAVKFDWLRTKYFGMYSKLAAGLTLRTESLDTNDPGVKSDKASLAHFNWQVSALGIEAGSPTVRGFAELGFGEQGVFLVGIRCKF